MTRPSKSRLRWSRFGAGLFCAWVVLLASPIQALTADQLLLITNRNVAASLPLAQLYTEQRQVPAGRILELDLPTTEELSFDTYERKVVPVVRGFLRQNHLEKQITCVVTFYGVPIRVAARVNPPSEREELAGIRTELTELPGKTEPLVSALEQLAASCDPAFITVNGPKKDLESLGRRAETALQRIGSFVNTTPDLGKRQEVTTKVQAILQPLVGSAGMLERQYNASKMASQKGANVTSPTTQLVTQLTVIRTKIRQLADLRYDAASREQLRVLFRESFGPFDLARVLQNQAGYLTVENTTAAFDNELAMLWWEYPRAGWVNNPLHYTMPVRPQDPPTLMVSRLDGPQSGTAREIIMTSLRAETDGLKGRIVIDSRGLPPQKNGRPDPFGQYDQTMRNLADLLQTKGTNVSLLFDEAEAVLRPGAAQGVAVYCGWYSVSRYVPACEFNQGAVAFHLASYTMATLRLEDKRGWCRGMLLDGAAVTFGPVDEPYLHSFPKADEFFPLLFTGKLSLAEVYWKTTPLASWMQTLIGDPLYTPYRINPVLKVDDLPMPLRNIFTSLPKTIAPPTTQSAARHTSDVANGSQSERSFLDPSGK